MCSSTNDAETLKLVEQQSLHVDNSLLLQASETDDEKTQMD
jgi:hypothetical protein